MSRRLRLPAEVGLGPGGILFLGDQAGQPGRDQMHELKDGSYCAAHRPRRPRGRQLAKLRARVFAAYRRRCRDCGRGDVALDVHHVNGDPMDNRIANTIPLCPDCHHKATFPRI